MLGKEQIIRQIMETGSVVNQTLIDSRKHLHLCVESFRLLPNSAEKTDLMQAIEEYEQSWGLFQDSVGDYVEAFERLEVS